MQIKILGNGGAINDGLPFNSFMIDEFFLVETPPDIMYSLFREKANLSEIRVIYLSHYHGDHYFGLPFLILRLFFNAAGEPLDYKIRLLGPADVQIVAKEICRLALGDNHPVNQWIDNNFLFTEISSGVEITLDDESILKIFPCFTLLKHTVFHFIKMEG
jgi:ribonuclease BN (tRNA processing enzyme)